MLLEADASFGLSPVTATCSLGRLKLKVLLASDSVAALFVRHPDPHIQGSVDDRLRLAAKRGNFYP